MNLAELGLGTGKRWEGASGGFREKEQGEQGAKSSWGHTPGSASSRERMAVVDRAGMETQERAQSQEQGRGHGVCECVCVGGEQEGFATHLGF